MPPILILAIVGAVLALLAKDEKNLSQDDQEELKKLQLKLAEARKSVRHAQKAKEQYLTSHKAKVEEKMTQQLPISASKASSAGNIPRMDKPGSPKKPE